MPRFGWMRLAYLLFVLTILVALSRVGDAEARSLAARVGDTDHPETPPGQRETPQAPRLTEDVISSLEDARGSTGHPDVGPNIAEPRIPPAPVPDDAEQRRTVDERERPEDKAQKAAATEPPVFYRPTDTDAAPDAGPVCGNLEGAPKSGKVVFSLEKRFYYSYEDTWGAPRTQGGHEGTDLMTPSGVPEYAVTDGTVVPVAGSDTDGWNTLGGYTVMVRADYSIGPVQQGDLFYYAHLEREGALPIGTRVQAGQVVGYAGDTGQGPPVTRGLFPPHLHLGWYDAGGAREEADSGAMNPYPLLEWIKANGGAVTGNSDARFCEAPRPAPPTSSGTDDGPANPGISPDLDTGSTDPKPSPAQRETRKENPKPDPPEKTAHEQASPTKKPSRPNPPEEQSRRDPDNAPARPPNSNGPEADKPPKPNQPAPEPTKQERPAPGQNQPNPADVPDQPEPGPSVPQYDTATKASPSPQANGNGARMGEPTPGAPPEKTARHTKPE